MSNVQDYTNPILDSIEIMTKAITDNLPFDKTIQGRVIRCTDPIVGKYIISYQDSTIIAYSDDPQRIYSAGTEVYIVVPSNDFSKKKRIVGMVSPNGEFYSAPLSLLDRYTRVGSNLLQGTTRLGLCSYKATDEAIFYPGSYSFDAEAARLYMEQLSYMMFGGTFYTDLAEEQTLSSFGVYGIEFKIKFWKKASTEQTVNRDYEVITYSFDSTMMEGNPYLFDSGSEQYWVAEIPMNRFAELVSVRIFSKSFPNTRSGMPDDIFVEVPQLWFCSPLSEEELANTSVRIVAQNDYGFIWPRSSSGTSTLELTQELRVKGHLVSGTDELAEYYWFIEDNTVNLSSTQLTTLAGPGWRCLNEYIQTDSGKVYQPGSKDWTITNMSLFPGLKTRIKAVAVYSNNKISDVKTITNKANSYTLELVAPQNIFYNDRMNTEDPIVTAILRLPNGTEVAYNQNTMSYSWSRIDSSGNYDTMTYSNYRYENSNGDYVNSTSENVYHIHQVGSIVNYIDIVATLTYQGMKISGGARIENRTDGAGSWTLIFDNDIQSFQYDEYGNSPTSKSGRLLDPIEILPIKVHLCQPDGQQIEDEDFLKGASITWEFPDVNDDDSLLVNPQVDTTYKNIVTFNIADKFDKQKRNNNIVCHVIYDGHDIWGKTNLLFVKQGQIGTNGTEYVFRIIPKANAKEVILVASGGQWYWRIDGSILYNPSYFPFEVALYKDNTLISVTQGTVKWRLLDQKNKNNSIIQFTNDESYGIITLASVSDSGIYQTNNVIRAEYTYDQKSFFATYSIPSLYNPSGYITGWQAGFDEVVYDTDGTHPAYTENNPFKISTTGSVYWYTTTGLNSPFEIVNPGSVSTLIYPPAILESDIFSYYVQARVYGTGAVLTIPIQMYHNRYGMPLANDWDGTSVKVSNDEGYITTPLIMAGQKNNDNSFTGMVMGKSAYVDTTAQSQKSSYDTQYSNGSKIGLMAYNQGTQTIFLDSQTGRAYFGKSGQGQIEMIPGGTSRIAGWQINRDSISATNSLKSRTDGDAYDNVTRQFKTSLYSPDSQQGKTNVPAADAIIINRRQVVPAHAQYYKYQKFNVNDKFIVYDDGSFKGAGGLFEVSEQGEITSTKGTIGGWHIEPEQLYSDKIHLDSTGNIRGGGSNDNPRWQINNDGSVFFNEGTIGGWHIDRNQLSLNSGSIKLSSNDEWCFETPGFKVNRSGAFEGADGSFVVNSSGHMTCTSGEIGGWTINQNDITRGNVTLGDDGSIYSGNWHINNDGSASFGNITCTNVWQIGEGSGQGDNSWWRDSGGGQGFHFGTGTIELGDYNDGTGIKASSNGDLKVSGEIIAKSGNIGGCVIENNSLKVDRAHITSANFESLYYQNNPISLTSITFMKKITNLQVDCTATSKPGIQRSGADFIDTNFIGGFTVKVTLNYEVGGCDVLGAGDKPSVNIDGSGSDSV